MRDSWVIAALTVRKMPTLAVGCTVAVGSITTSPTMVGAVLPSPVLASAAEFFFLNSRSTTSWQRVISLRSGEAERDEGLEARVPGKLDLEEEVHGLVEEHLVAHNELREEVALERDDHLTRRGALYKRE